MTQVTIRDSGESRLLQTSVRFQININLINTIININTNTNLNNINTTLIPIMISIMILAIRIIPDIVTTESQRVEVIFE